MVGTKASKMASYWPEDELDALDSLDRWACYKLISIDSVIWVYDDGSLIYLNKRTNTYHSSDSCNDRFTPVPR